jgi:hypothetical protein
MEYVTNSTGKEGEKEESSSKSPSTRARGSWQV